MPKFLSSLSSLIYPQSCLACHEILNLRTPEEGSSNTIQAGLCFICATEIRREAVCEIRYGMKVYSGSRFSPRVSRIILAAKEDNNFLARKWLVSSLKLALSLALVSIYKLNTSGDIKIALVPIPSRSSVNRSRGFRHANLLATELSKVSFPADVRVFSNLLSHKARVRDQSKLRYEERRVNMKDSMVAQEQLGLSGHRVFLLDDLVTSGLTLRAAKAAMEARGVAVNGAICASSNMAFRNEPDLKVA